MSENEWLEATDPGPMLEFLRGKVTERKLRLFAVACSRRVSHLLADNRSREAVEVAEQFADGRASAEALEESRENAADASGAAHRAATSAGWPAGAWVTNAAANAAYGACGHWQNWADDVRLFDAHDWTARALAGPSASGEPGDGGEPDGAAREQRVNSQLFRCIFGNPFRPVVFDPSWRTETVIALARGMYDTRSFDAAPVLADALEDAGCDDAEVLGHLRGGGPHVRGCWCVDGVMGLL